MRTTYKKINTKDSIICSNNNSIFNYFAWPTVSRLPDGNLGMVASGFRLDHICPFGKIVICYSKDEGITWSKPAILIDTPLDDRDPGIVVFNDNKVIVTSFNRPISFYKERIETRPEHPFYNFMKSYLDCINETIEKNFLGSIYLISEDGGYTFGEFKKVPITAPHGPCLMLDKSLLYIGRTYTALLGGKDQIECYKQDENNEFKYLSSIENINDEYGPLESCEPHAIVLPNTKILVHIRVQRPSSDPHPVFTIYQSESYDNGKTFTKPHQIGLKSGAPSHIFMHSSGILIASYGYREKPYGQRVMFSKDNGESWDIDYILRDDGTSKDLGYPATVERNDGSLLTVYYQKEEGRRNCVIMQSIWDLPKHLLI